MILPAARRTVRVVGAAPGGFLSGIAFEFARPAAWPEVQWFAPGMALLKAYLREQKQGRGHPEWLAWCREFADWLLTQQQPGGGFPRSWKPGTGEVVSASPSLAARAIRISVC
jgi:hypothetical protein